MNKSMKFLTLFITTTMTITILAGCGAKTSSESSSSSTITNTESEAKAGNPTLPLVTKPTTFKVWQQTSADITSAVKTLDNNEYYKELEKRTGVHIEFIHPTMGQEQASLNLLIASGDFPDIVQMTMGTVAYPGGMDKAISDGSFIKLNDLAKKYAPNYLKLANSSADNIKATITDSGNIAGFYGISPTVQPAWFGNVVRQDWLDELGLKTPVTFDDWHTMLKAFKEKKGAVAPMMLNYTGFSYSDIFNAGYGVGEKFYQVDGKVKFGPLESGYKEYLTMMNKWFSEGLIDKDFATKHDFVPSTTYTSTGKAGAWTDIYVLLSVDKAKSGSSTYRAVGVPAPVKTAGDSLHLRQLNINVGTTYCSVSKSCKDPATAVKWLDYAFSPDGAMLANYGIKDSTYTIGSDGKPAFTELITKNPAGLTPGQGMAKYVKAPPSGDMEYHWERELTGQPKDNLEAQELWGKNNDGAYNFPTGATLTTDEGTEFAQITGDINTYISEMNIKFIIGKEPMSNYDQYVSKIKSMNIDKAIKLEQAALDRYNARK